jgi:site-specific DNA-methyltransferase (adenine-specific)
VIADQIPLPFADVAATTMANLSPQQKSLDLQAKWNTKAGQTWIAESLYTPGRFHWLTAGSCLESATMKAFASHGADAIFTSPPYADRRVQEYPSIKPEDYPDWFEQVGIMATIFLQPHGSFFFNVKEHVEHGERQTYVMRTLLALIDKQCWHWIDTLCWIRNSLPGNKGPRFKNYWEPVYHLSKIKNPRIRKTNVLVRGTKMENTRTYQPGVFNVRLDPDYDGNQRGNNQGLRAKDHDGAEPSNVIVAHKGFAKNKGHGAVFPIRLPLWFMLAYSDPGDVWLDPFGGSGRTILAAEMCGRVGWYVDLLPRHLAVALQGLADMGLRPQLVDHAL